LVYQSIAGPYVTMAVAVYFESVLQNQHKFCNRRPPMSVTSRHLCVRPLVGNSHGLETRMHSLPVRPLQKQGRFCVRCSSTADASRDSCMPLPTLYELLEIPQHVGEYFITSTFHCRIGSRFPSHVFSHHNYGKNAGC
jgi:hypothetical protein